MTLRAPALLAVLLLSPAAHASGFLFGENGARALSMGGAFVAQADDLSAIQHNPAGLMQLQGLHFIVDLSLLNHEVSFQRRDPESVPENQRFTPEEVHNRGKLFALPVLGFGYGRALGGRRFNLSLGLYGPPTVGRYKFPRPNYAAGEREKFEENPIKYAPQRYGLIENDILIVFPTLAVSYEVHSKVSVGASFQYVYSHLTFEQVVSSIQFTPGMMRREDPDWDAVAKVEQTGRPQFTGILGVLVRPTERIQLGASYRPPVKIKAIGTISVTPSPFLENVVGVEQIGDRASFEMTLPQELKLGAHFQPLAQLGVAVEAVYQGWQSVGEFVLTPEDIQISRAGTVETLEPLHIPKKWKHAWGGRLGASWRFPFGLTARGGVLVEQSGIPDERLHIDFLHFNRAFFTAGAEYELGPISLLLTGAFTPTRTKEVGDSLVQAGNTSHEIPGSIIGNGTYRSGGWVVGMGVRGNFGGRGEQAQ